MTILTALIALRDECAARAAAADADRNYDLSAYLTAKRDGVHDAIHQCKMTSIAAAEGGVLRLALAEADPATLTHADRAALLDLLDRAYRAAGIQ